MKNRYAILLLSFVCVYLIYSQTAMPLQQSKKDFYKPLEDKVLQNETYIDVNYGIVHLTNGEFIINKENGFIGDLRFLAKGDLNGDGNEDVVVVLFSYQGGNDPDETLCAVLNNHGKPNMVSCVPLNANTDSIRIENDTIIVRELIYDKDDAHCCPSKQGILKFVLVGKEIRRAE